MRPGSGTERAHASVGAGLRWLHKGRALLRLDVATGSEGAAFYLRIGPSF